MLNKIFGMISLGCDKNRVDGERILGEIRAHGCSITDDLTKAQILIVNTCAFLNSARKESIEAILEGNGYRSERLEKIVVTGCLPQKFIDEIYPALTEADVFLGVSDAKELFPALERAYRGERVNGVGRGEEAQSLKERVITTPEHFKYLKISEGCSHHCTYCLIPKIRGRYRSVPMAALLREAESLGETEELILIAQDVSRYGEDFGQNRLVELIRGLSGLENIKHIRLLYCYPERIGEELIEEFKTNSKLLHYLDIPLQHSEDRILKLMGRQGTRGEYLALMKRLRQEIPDLALRTTFISGFPTETEEEHRALISFLEEVKFENCGFFAYSREPETPAYEMKGQIPAAVKKRRVRELYRAQAKISHANLEKFVGKRIKVLCDGIDYERSCFVGRAYFQAPEIDGCVYFRASKGRQGEYYMVTVERTGDYDFFGSGEEVER